MSTDYNKPDTNCTLFINKIPRGKGIHVLTAMEQDASTAAATRKLCVVVLKTTTTREISAGLQGTYVTVDSPSMLPRMNCGGTNDLTGLIEPLNSWLRRRVQVVMSESDPARNLAVLDAEIDAYGFPGLRNTVLGLAGSTERKILIEDPEGNGGLLVLPPSSHILAPSQNMVSGQNEDQSGTVVSVEKVTELTTASGCCHVVPTDVVSSAIHAGVTARLGHPHAGCAIWRPVFAIRLSNSSEEN